MYPKALLLSVLTFTSSLYASQNSAWYSSLPDATLKEALPEWALEDMSRETEPTESSVISFGDSHRLELEGKLLAEPAWSEDNGHWYFEVNYGAEAVLDCFLYDWAEHPLDLLSRLRSYVLPWYVGENMTQADSFVAYSGMHLQNDNPVYGLDNVEYLTDENDNLGVALTQGRVSYQNDSVLACLSVEFGYRESFDRVFNKMVDTWEILLVDRADPFYREVYVSFINGTARGFADYSYETDADGDVVSKRKVAFMVATRPGEVSLSDVAGVEYVTTDGDMINSYVSSIENGELASSLSLNSAGDGEWLIEGEMKGKGVEFSIADGRNPSSLLAQSKNLKNLIADSQQNNLESWVWTPSADPSTFLPLKVLEINRKADENEITIALGPIEMDSIVSDKGSAKTAIMSMGAFKIELERVVVEGDLE